MHLSMEAYFDILQSQKIKYILFFFISVYGCSPVCDDLTKTRQKRSGHPDDGKDTGLTNNKQKRSLLDLFREKIAATQERKRR